MTKIISQVHCQVNYLVKKIFNSFFSIIEILWSILVDYGKNLPIMDKYGQSKVFFGYFKFLLLLIFAIFWWNFGQLYVDSLLILVNFSKNFLKIVLSSQLFTQLLLEVKCQGNYLLNYYWKSNVKAIIFSIITWSGLVKSGFESSLGSSLDSEGKGRSRV